MSNPLPKFCSGTPSLAGEHLAIVWYAEGISCPVCSLRLEMKEQAARLKKLEDDNAAASFDERRGQ